MRYWDPSAIVPLVVTETATPDALTVLAVDPLIVTWWASVVECASAISRKEREGDIAGRFLDAANSRLRSLEATWVEVRASDTVRRTAMRLLRTHPLRAADALQLASAVSASLGEPGSLSFVTLDDRLALAAEKEGFPVVRPGDR